MQFPLCRYKGILQDVHTMISGVKEQVRQGDGQGTHVSVWFDGGEG